tara:strand:- start:103 stop:585 length:483 start_codon:yes stop_codon:yes gene_type:complete
MTSDLRIGFGVDYHQIQKGNSMILGGIKIDCGYSILAHSDGDIILHSICDALLGAASMGDLGSVFKEDESTENISSSVLLNQVLNLLSRESYQVVNIDITYVGEVPRISKYREEILSNLSKIMNLNEKLLSLKSTTTDKIGTIGKREGVACYCSTLIQKK